MRPGADRTTQNVNRYGAIKVNSQGANIFKKTTFPADSVSKLSRVISMARAGAARSMRARVAKNFMVER